MHASSGSVFGTGWHLSFYKLTSVAKYGQIVVSAVGTSVGADGTLQCAIRAMNVVICFRLKRYVNKLSDNHHYRF